MAPKKAKKTKRPAPARARPVRRATDRGAQMRFAMETCSVSNPFCPEAIGSRWPDNSHTKSVGWSLTGQPASCGTDANGSACQVFTPTGQRATGVVTGSSAAFPNAMTNYSLPANVVRWRVTSYGIRISCPLSKMTATGTLFARLVSPMTGATLDPIDYTSIQTDSNMDIPLSRLIDRDLFIVAKPLGDNAHWFNAGTPQAVTTLATTTNPGWQYIVIGVAGAPASNSEVLKIKLYYNYEFVFEDGSAFQSFAAAPPADSPAVRQGNSSVLATIGNFIEGTAEKVDQFFKSKAFQVGSRLALAAGTKNPAPLMLTVD